MSIRYDPRVFTSVINLTQDFQYKTNLNFFKEISVDISIQAKFQSDM
jgi:hypothetical protein